MGHRTRGSIWLELMLQDASIKQSSVASTLTAVSARAMLAAIDRGRTRPCLRTRGWAAGRCTDMLRASDTRSADFSDFASAGAGVEQITRVGCAHGFGSGVHVQLEVDAPHV